MLPAGLMSFRETAVVTLVCLCVSCSKTEQAASVGEEAPTYGLTEAQADEVLATVGDRTITVGEFAERLGSQSPYLRARFESPERRREFLDNLIRFELLVHEAKRRGYADRPEVTRARRNAMVQQLIKREVEDKLAAIEITDEEIRTEYDANADEYNRPAQVRANDILIKEKKAAQKVLAKAKKVKNIEEFRALARENSEDESTKARGGDLQFFTMEGEQGPPMAIREAAFAVNKVGSVYPELVETEDGYHVLMVTGKRAPLTRTYEQAKRAIRHKLSRRRKDVAMETLLERLRAESEVEIDYDVLSEVRVDVPGGPEGDR